MNMTRGLTHILVLAVWCLAATATLGLGGAVPPGKL